MLPVGNKEMAIFDTHGHDVFTCNNIFYTRLYHFYTHGCDVFT